MKICKVSSIPLKEVIISIAQCFNVDYHESCSEYYLELPHTIGKGQIRGINFDNGLGIIIYQCEFYEDIRIDFTVDQIHPIKYIYSVNGPVYHRFADEKDTHEIAQYKCAIVASNTTNGHILSFKKNVKTDIVSLEINREIFLKSTICEMTGVTEDLRKLYQDVLAENTFYHDGFYGIEFKTLLTNISQYENLKLVRKFYLESIGLQIFVNQLLQFEDDQLNESNKTILRINEIKRIEKTTSYISQNLDEDLSISALSRASGLNPNKLQTGFKHLYNFTVNEFVINVRLETAYQILQNEDINVSETVSRIGLKSLSYFSKIFKEKYHISPSVFKDLNDR
ncbi:helix-turn-helix domain-containing protein [Winogradskyella bathintestinalis]|uniref:AraC family transcriptional regulator n=1 Tax=Winogradskyella bathintestinalis TaxID=3035208 RepID=A0ABT7ZU64_9FLAO|nr:AraC family transcriptional regulator [Winogradskyella bathintestinalis]MDN3492560.1 AraC family transcriptional regulator [Winogradskyella bathintestinalis]